MQNRIRLLGFPLVILFALSCKKEATSTMPESIKVEVHKNSKISFYFRGTIDGKLKDWTVADYKNGDNLSYRFNSASGIDTLGSDCVNTFCKYMIEDVVIFQNNVAGPTKNYIAAGFSIGSKTGNRNDIINQFAIGQKTFGKPRFHISDPVKDGVYVYYIDENGKEWSSHFGSGNQTTSIFKSEQFLPQTFTEISCRNIWRATFSCTLYDRNSNSIRLDNCEFFTPVIVN
jgi:phage pi2 protein 07